jgi:PKHD-type hydroxylase
MIICIANLLTPDALCKLRDLLEGARFADGKATAGWHAKLVKHNEQAIAPHTATQEAAAMVAAALRGNEVFLPPCCRGDFVPSSSRATARDVPMARMWMMR